MSTVALSTTAELTARATDLLAALGVSFPSGDQIARTPISGGALGPVGPGTSPADVDAVVSFELDEPVLSPPPDDESLELVAAVREEEPPRLSVL